MYFCTWQVEDGPALAVLGRQNPQLADKEDGAGQVLQVLHLGGRRADGEGVAPAASLHRHPFHGVLPAGTPTRVNQRALKGA